MTRQIMDIKKLQEQIEQIEAEAKAKKFKVIKAYCLANNTVKVGDIFNDDMGSIIVEKIGFAVDGINGGYCCTYKGPVLTAKLKPRKDRSSRKAWQR